MKGEKKSCSRTSIFGNGCAHTHKISQSADFYELTNEFGRLLTNFSW